MAVHLCGILSPNPSLIMRKTSDTQTEGHSTVYLVSTSQDCQGHEKQGKIRGKWGDMTSKQRATPDCILEQKEDIKGKTGELVIQSGV